MVRGGVGVVEEQGCLCRLGPPCDAGVALVLIVIGGLTRSGGGAADHPHAGRVPSRSLGGHITLMGVIGGVLSAFMNNVAPTGVAADAG